MRQPFSASELADHTGSMRDLETELELFTEAQTRANPSSVMQAGIGAFVALFVMPGLIALVAAVALLLASARDWLDTAEWVWITNREALQYAGQSIPWSDRKGVEQLLELALNTPLCLTLAAAGAIWAFVLPFGIIRLVAGLGESVHLRRAPTAPQPLSVR